MTEFAELRTATARGITQNQSNPQQMTGNADRLRQEISSEHTIQTGLGEVGLSLSTRGLSASDRESMHRAISALQELRDLGYDVIMRDSRSGQMLLVGPNGKIVGEFNPRDVDRGHEFATENLAVALQGQLQNVRRNLSSQGPVRIPRTGVELDPNKPETRLAAQLARNFEALGYKVEQKDGMLEVRDSGGRLVGSEKLNGQGATALSAALKQLYNKVGPVAVENYSVSGAVERFEGFLALTPTGGQDWQDLHRLARTLRNGGHTLAYRDGALVLCRNGEELSSARINHQPLDDSPACGAELLNALRRMTPQARPSTVPSTGQAFVISNDDGSRTMEVTPADRRLHAVLLKLKERGYSVAYGDARSGTVRIMRNGEIVRSFQMGLEAGLPEALGRRLEEEQASCP